MTRFYYAGGYLVLSALCLTTLDSALLIVVYQTVACILATWIFELHPAGDQRHLNFLLAPAVVAGLCASVTSSNGLMNAALGLLPGLLMLMAFFFMESEQRAHGSRFRRIMTLQYSAVVLLVGVTMLVGYYGTPYRETPIDTMTAKVTRGPYAGLYTSPERKEYVEAFMDVVEQLPERAASITFMDGLPMGYLFSDREPKSRMLYMHSAPYRGWLDEYMADYYEDPANRPDALVFLDVNDRRHRYPLKRELLASGEYRLFRTIENDNGTKVQFALR